MKKLLVAIHSMATRLICRDGTEVRLPTACLQKLSLFNNPEMANAHRLALQSSASPEVVNLFLDCVEDATNVTITEDNFHELQSRCDELGFSGLDKKLREFDTRQYVKVDRVLLLEERVARHDKLLVQLQRQLSQLLIDKTNTETKMQESAKKCQSLENKVEETKKGCEKRISEASRIMAQSLSEYAKQCQLSGLLAEVEQLKKRESQCEGRTVHALTLRPKQLVYNESNKLNGIIAHLTRECGGNVHDKGIVNVTASSICHGPFHPKNAADIGKNSPYYSNSEDDAWICYDFKEGSVIPTNYSVRLAYGEGLDTENLKSWVIEVSNDAKSWVEIDRRDENQDLKAPLVTHTFRVAHVPYESFRFFRLRQTGMNHGGNAYMRITSLEIFGALFDTYTP